VVLSENRFLLFEITHYTALSQPKRIG
jgi:hypothetical protein